MKKAFLFKIELLTLFMMLVIVSSLIIYYETNVAFSRAVWTATLAAFAKTFIVQIHKMIFARWHKKNDKGDKQTMEPENIVF